jgi:hypothetical protein
MLITPHIEGAANHAETGVWSRRGLNQRGTAARLRLIATSTFQ